MWGRAVYFAQKASYSKDYAHPLGLYKQMFLGEVVLGDCVLLAQQTELERPPKKPNSMIEYDSVQGYTSNSDVFMVYANSKCYPRYLVTFKP